MRVTRRLFWVLGLVGLLALVGGRAAASVETVDVIVELDTPPAAYYVAKANQAERPLSDDELAERRSELRAGQDALLQDLTDRGIAHNVHAIEVEDGSGTPVSIELRYTLVFNGIALTVPASAVAALEATDGVKAVHPDAVLPTNLDRSVAYIRAPEVYGAVAELTPFDDLAEGFEGQGITISVIDTGIEWFHPMFGADPAPPRLGVAPASPAGANQKVIYNLPFTDIVNDGFGHGTHVASTAAGYLAFTPGPDGVPSTADDLGIHGVAPQARLMTYKVCSDSLSTIGSLTGLVGGCPTSLIVFAIEDSVSPQTVNGFPKPVAHVINMSLGGAGGPGSPTAVASDNAVRAGSIVVSSAGNSGPGPGTVGAPAAGRRVIAVAASNDPGVAPNSIEVLGRPGTNPILAVFAPQSNAGRGFSASVSQHYVYAGFADTPDAVPATVAGRICLAERGSSVSVAGQGTGLFANKAAQCSAKGGIALVVFNNVPGPIGSVLAPATIPVFTISRENGLFLRDELGFDGLGISQFQIRLNPADSSLFVPEVAGFSSRGPVQGLGQVKPDVSAPGVNVLAGLPVASVIGAVGATTLYGSVSGTSMASPHSAGAAGLVKQARPDWNADMIRTALMNTATNLREPDGTPKPAAEALPVLTQGAGLIDVFEAVNAKALLGVAGDGISRPTILGSHSFGGLAVAGSGCTRHETVRLTVRDVSGETVTYTFGVVGSTNADLEGFRTKITPGRVKVPAGGSGTVTLRASFDGEKIAAGAAPVDVQWYVEAVATEGTERLRMPVTARVLAAQPGASCTQIGDAQSPIEGTVTVPAPGHGIRAIGTTSAVFEFDVLAGKDNARLIVQATPALPADADLYLQRRNADGTWSNDLERGESGSLTSETLEAGRLPAGVYRIEVHNFLGPAALSVRLALTFYNSDGMAGT